MEEILQNKLIISICTFIVGIIFGSFATALIYRLPRDIDWVKKRSSCPKCKNTLNIIDLFPVFSYIFFAGKCRYCKTKISPNYLIIEVLMGLGFVAIALYKGVSYESLAIMFMFFLTVILSAIDFEHYIIPDGTNLSFLIIGLIYSIGILEREYSDVLISSIFYGGLAFALRWFMYAWKKKEGLGMGDVKFFFAVGTIITIYEVSVFLLLSGLIGIIIAILWKILGKGKMFPFGPALSISLLLCILFPEMSEFLLLIIQQNIYS